jgi:hypothetical protein
VIDPVVESLGLGKEVGIEIARKDLEAQLKVDFGKEQLLLIEVADNTPQKAQATANALIDSWLKYTLPSEEELKLINNNKDISEHNLTIINEILDRTSLGGTASQGTRTLSIDYQALTKLIELKSKFETEVLNYTHAQSGLSRDVVLQAPTLPKTAAPQRKILITLLSAVVAGFVLIMFLSVRASLRSSAAEPAVALKQAKIRKALGMKSGLDSYDGSQTSA